MTPPLDLARLLEDHRCWSGCGETPLVVTYAPGRVNLIGEHTDYHGGLVLPIAIDAGVTAVASRRSDGRVRVHSRELERESEFDTLNPQRDSAEPWADTVKGVVALLPTLGVDRIGLDLSIASTLPIGGGLASSAALSVALSEAIARTAGAELEPWDVIHLACNVEEDFVGVRCGLMDPAVSRLARPGHAMLLDCRTEAYRFVPLPNDLAVVLLDSGVRHQLATSAYNDRRAACDRALAQLQATWPEVKGLLDCFDCDHDAVLRLVDPELVPYVRHVLTEQQRTRDTVRALESGDLDTVRRCLAAGHRSLRDDYRVSCAEADRLVELASALPGCYGARMTGGGFGGYTVNLVLRNAVSSLVSRVSAGFCETYHRSPAVQLTAAVGGARPLLHG